MRKIAILSLLLVAALIARVVFFDRDISGGENLPVVNLADIRLGAISPKHSSIAEARSDDRAVLRAQISGQVVFFAQEGEILRKGQPFGRILADEYQAQISQARVRLAQVEEAEKNARRHWDKFNPNERRQFVLASRQAREALRETEAVAAKTILRAPFDGRLAHLFVDSGTVVVPGTPLARIDGGNLRLEFWVSPERARTLFVGKEVFLRKGEIGEKGRVKILSIGGAERGGKTKVVVSPSSDSAFYPGDLVEVSWSSEPIVEGLLVPREAVLSRYDDDLVFVYDENEQTVSLRSVKVIAMDEHFAQIDGDLKAGEKVVMSADLLRDGEKVVLSDRD